MVAGWGYQPERIKSSYAITKHFIFSSANKSPTLLLIQEIYDDMVEKSKENKIAIENIQGNIEKELSSLRNLTLKSNSGKGILCLSFNVYNRIVIEDEYI